jgi:ABC-type lipoprotein export system ATPase subunit
VSIELHPGELVALVGRSGCGKSTLLHLAGGLADPDAGRISVAGSDLGRLSARDRAALRRRHVGFVFQAFHLLSGLTAEENVALPLVLDGARDAVDAARELLDRVGLGHRRSHYPAELSGGEMQRVAIARALICRPGLVLADEPTGSLDSLTGASVLSVLQSMVSEAGAAMLLATHDHKVASRADRVLTLSDGRLL